MPEGEGQRIDRVFRTPLWTVSIYQMLKYRRLHQKGELTECLKIIFLTRSQVFHLDGDTIDKRCWHEMWKKTCWCSSTKCRSDETLDSTERTYFTSLSSYCPHHRNKTWSQTEALLHVSNDPHSPFGRAKLFSHKGCPCWKREILVLL